VFWLFNCIFTCIIFSDWLLCVNTCCINSTWKHRQAHLILPGICVEYRWSTHKILQQTGILLKQCAQ